MSQITYASLTVRLRVHIGDSGWTCTLAHGGNAEFPQQSFRILTRHAGDTPRDRIQQNYSAFVDTQRGCPVLEAEIGLINDHAARSSMCVGVPAAKLGFNRTYDIVLRFSGVCLALFIDGVLVDEDWPIGDMPQAAVVHAGRQPGTEVFSLEVIPRAVSDQEVVAWSGGAERVAQRTIEILGSESSTPNYWSPRGHNQWAGDVVFGDTRAFDPKRLHLFYLIDRRHGVSKWSAGGHNLAHMSSADLIHWDHHPLAIELDAWNSLGTGRVVATKDALIMAYGLHTSRVIPESNLGTVLQNDAGVGTPRIFAEDGRFPDSDIAAGKYPQGSSLALSHDGVHFEKSRQLVHECQNPGVVRAHDGQGYLLFAGYGQRGLYHSNDLTRWRLINPAIIPINEQSPVGNTDECQCHFEWHGWHYLIAGRTGFWMSRHQTGPYWPGPDGGNVGVVTPRWNIHDGLWVPMVAEFGDNRRILAGFLTGPDAEWAGHLVFREMLAMPDGSLGLTWPVELRPRVREMLRPIVCVGERCVHEAAFTIGAVSQQWATITDLPPGLLLSLRITPGFGTTHIAIAGCDDQGNGCALSCLITAARVQWGVLHGDHLPRPLPSTEEILANDPAPLWSSANPHLPFKGGDFTITAVEGLAQMFTVELLCIPDAKSRSTIMDACIGGHRTLITRRAGLTVDRLRFMADGPATIEIVHIGSL